MENNENSVVKNEGEKMMKLQRKNSFVKMKKKPLVLAIAIAGMIIIGGLGSLKFINTDKFDINLAHYDKTITLSADVKKNGLYETNIESCTLAENQAAAYNMRTSSDWDVYVGPNNATLIDIDPEGKDPLMSKLKPYNKAIVNYVGKIEQLNLTAASVGYLKDHVVYIQSHNGKRQLVSANNTVIYREINEKDLKQFKNEGKYDKLYIDLNNDLLKFDEFVGERDLVVNDITLKSLAVKWNDGKYYEYLALADQCVYEGKINNNDQFKYSNNQTKYTRAMVFPGNNVIPQSDIKNANIIIESEHYGLDPKSTFVHILTADGRKLKVSSTNSILISENRNEIMLDSSGRIGAGSDHIILGIKNNNTPIISGSFGVRNSEFQNLAYKTANPAETYQIVTGFDYGMPILKVPASELKNYNLFEQKTFCTVKTFGFEEMFEAVGYQLFQWGNNLDFEYFKVLKKEGDGYVAYYMPKGSFMLSSRDLGGIQKTR